MMRTNKRTISVGKLRTESLAYLPGFFGEIVSRDEMITLQDAAQKVGARYVGSGAWHMLCHYEVSPTVNPPEADTFARDTVDMAADRMLSGIRWRYGRQCKLFMEGYLDGLPSHLSLSEALEMMKLMAPSYFKDGAE